MSVIPYNANGGLGWIVFISLHYAHIPVSIIIISLHESSVCTFLEQLFNLLLAQLRRLNINTCKHIYLCIHVSLHTITLPPMKKSCMKPQNKINVYTSQSAIGTFVPTPAACCDVVTEWRTALSSPNFKLALWAGKKVVEKNASHTEQLFSQQNRVGNCTRKGRERVERGRERERREGGMCNWPVKHFSLIRIPCYETIHLHRLVLTNPMTSCLSLHCTCT